MAAAAPFTALAYVCFISFQGEKNVLLTYYYSQTSFVGVAAASWWFGYSFKASDLAHQHEAYIKHEESQKTKYEDLQKLYKETSTKLDKIGK